MCVWGVFWPWGSLASANGGLVCYYLTYLVELGLVGVLNLMPMGVPCAGLGGLTLVSHMTYNLGVERSNVTSTISLIDLILTNNCCEI